MSEQQVAVEKIVVGDRARKDLGDVAALMASIEDVGLLQAIGIDPEFNLIFGRRRIEACTRLGFTEIRATVITNLNTAAAMLRAEEQENTCRKDLTPLERKALTDRLLEIEKPKAAERLTEAQGRGRKTRSVGLCSAEQSPTPTALDRAAAAAGWSRGGYHRVNQVVEAAKDDDPVVAAKASELLAELEKNTISPGTALRELLVVQPKQAPKRSPRSTRSQSTADRLTRAMPTLESVIGVFSALDLTEPLNGDDSAYWIDTIDRTLEALRATRKVIGNPR